MGGKKTEHKTSISTVGGQPYYSHILYSYTSDISTTKLIGLYR
jgi:hypothetical protein